MITIYKITNDIDDKVYIGQTKHSLEKRLKIHFHDSQLEKIKNRPFYAAINKYGSEHFFIEPIEKCSAEKGDEREMFWIEKYDSFKNGYNATYGGAGKAFIDKKLTLKLWNEGKSVKEISDITKRTREGIADFLHEKGVSKEETTERSHKTKKKSVLMYDMEGNYIREFSSSREVMRHFTNNPSGGGHIAAVCKGQRKSAFGYIWKYKETE